MLHLNSKNLIFWWGWVVRVKLRFSNYFNFFHIFQNPSDNDFVKFHSSIAFPALDIKVLEWFSMSELSEATKCELFTDRLGNPTADLIRKELRKDLTDKYIKHALKIFDSSEFLRGCDENKRASHDSELEPGRAKKLRLYTHSDTDETDFWSKPRENETDDEQRCVIAYFFWIQLPDTLPNMASFFFS